MNVEFVNIINHFSQLLDNLSRMHVSLISIRPFQGDYIELPYARHYNSNIEKMNSISNEVLEYCKRKKKEEMELD